MARLVVPLFAFALLLSACEPAPVVGASCMYPSDCRRPLTCRFERCRNQCVLNRDCPVGATCLIEPRTGDGVCGVTQDEGCEGGADCDADLVCVSNRCVGRCRDATDCPEDGVCAAVAGTSTRVCFDVRAEIPDAEVIDASTRDMGAVDATQTDAGEGDVGPSDASVTVPGVIEMCIGPYGMCALGSDGDVHCWGLGNNGRIGHGDEVDSIVPLPVLDRGGVLPIAGIDHIACGNGFGCAHVMHTGVVLCWGEGSHGELGFGASGRLLADEVLDDDPDEPIQVAGGLMSAAGYHICVLDTVDEALTCWGDNSGLIDLSHAARAPGTEPLPPSPPIGPGAVSQVRDFGVAAGGACVVRGTPRTISCWGQDDHGEAGLAPFVPLPDLAPLTSVSLGGAREPSHLAVGWTHRTVRVAPTNELLSWGQNSRAQLGSAAAFDTEVPVGPRTGTPVFTEIASDGFSSTTCGVISGETGAISGHVRCWGDNALGQAGLGTTIPSVEPRDDVVVGDAAGPPLENAVRVFVGPGNGCAATRSGELWCWGQNDVGQLGLPIDPPSTVRAAVRIDIP